MKHFWQFFLTLVLTFSAQARIWVVNQNGTGDFLTIQAAVISPSVMTGDTIFLAPSNHYEGSITNNARSLTFMGAGHDVSIIRTPSGGTVFNIGGGVVRIVGLGLHTYGSSPLINASSCDTLTLSSLSLIGGSPSVRVVSVVTSNYFAMEGSYVSGEVYLQEMKASVRRNIIYSTSNVALYLVSARDGSEIRNNVMRAVPVVNYGVLYVSQGSLLVTNNVVYSTPASSGPLIITYGTSGFVFNNILRDGYQTIVGGSAASGFNCSYNNSYGTLPGVGNIYGDPRFVRFNLTQPPDSLDFHFLANSPCIDAGNPDNQYNDVDGSRNDMGVYGGVRPLPSAIPSLPDFPSVTFLSVSPVIVPGNGTIEIRATGRVGPRLR